MSTLALKPSAHVVDVLGNVIGRDQPILRMEKALEMISLLGENIFEDENVVFFDPFCKAGELLLACAFLSCKAKSKKSLLDLEIITKEIYESDRYFGLAPDERHHRLSLRTFLGNETSHNEKYNHIIRDGHYLSEEDGRLDQIKYEKEFNSMIDYIKSKVGNKKIIAVGNPPYQEADGGGNGKSAIPVYNIFTESLIDCKSISEFVLVIPSRWFAGGKGLDNFRKRIIDSKNVKKIINFTNSSDIFPTVDINGGVCFLSFDKEKTYNEITFQTGNQIEKLNLDDVNIIPDDPMAITLFNKIKGKWNGKWVSDVAFPRNAFTIFSNEYKTIKEKNLATKDEVKCYFLRKQIRFIDKKSLKSGQNLIHKYKVVVPKAAGGSKGKRRSTIPENSFFILKPNEICSETYSIVHTFDKMSEAENFCEYLKTNFARYFVGLRKITQNVSRSSWEWVPCIDTSKKWDDSSLATFFGLTKSEFAHMQKQVKEWS